jgi:hypothetical protein
MQIGDASHEGLKVAVRVQLELPALVHVQQDTEVVRYVALATPLLVENLTEVVEDVWDAGVGLQHAVSIMSAILLDTRREQFVTGVQHASAW